MKNNILKRALALLLALVCVMGILPLAAFTDGGASAPGSITQKSAVGLRVDGHAVRYPTANATVNHSGLAYVFDAQVQAEGMDAPIAPCARIMTGSSIRHSTARSGTTPRN